MANPIPHSSSTPLANPVSIINPDFCVSDSIDLAIDGDLVVRDDDGNMVFKVKPASVTLHDRQVLLDAAGNHFVTLRKKLMTTHDRWQVFRGESSKRSDLLFSVKGSPMFRQNTKLGVFLKNNKTEEICDFRVVAEESWSCVIYDGESTTIIARMHKIGDNLKVRVQPNIDYAFVIALILIFDAMNTKSSSCFGVGNNVYPAIHATTDIINTATNVAGVANSYAYATTNNNAVTDTYANADDADFDSDF
ncbi:hypothetical protein PTKIN_Ptkin16aG0010600 [Pterospermum kingtungense]